MNNKNNFFSFFAVHYALNAVTKEAQAKLLADDLYTVHLFIFINWNINEMC